MVARPWWDDVLLTFADAQSCNRCAAAFRGFNFTLTTRAGPVEPVIVIRDRPPPIQRRGRGIHPFVQILKDEMITAAEEMKPLHRDRGANPYSTLHAVNPKTGEARLLLALHWSDVDPGADRINILEMAPDEALNVGVCDRLKKLALP